MRNRGKREEVKRTIDRRDGIEVADGESERRKESRGHRDKRWKKRILFISYRPFYLCILVLSPSSSVVEISVLFCFTLTSLDSTSSLNFSSSRAVFP